MTLSSSQPAHRLVGGRRLLKATVQAETELKHRETDGQVQQGSHGLGLRANTPTWTKFTLSSGCHQNNDFGMMPSKNILIPIVK